MHNVLLDNPIHPEALALLQREVEVRELYEASLPELQQAIADADATIVSTRFPITREVIARGARLQVVGRPGAGVDSVDVRAASEAGIPVVYTPDGPTESVVEHALCFMLMLAKSMLPADAATRRGDFAFRLRVQSTELQGKTLGIIGGGHIGSRLSLVCHGALDMRVLIYDPYLSPEQAQACGAGLCTTLQDLLGQSDFVSIHTPLTPQTRKLVGARELAWMKPSAYLINTSRGPVVDEAALSEALRTQRIAGAGLDVFEQEPPAADSPLFSMPNVALSPHMASFTDEGRYRMGMTVAQEVLDVLGGKHPPFLANPEVWERRRILD